MLDWTNERPYHQTAWVYLIVYLIALPHIHLTFQHVMMMHSIHHMIRLYTMLHSPMLTTALVMFRQGAPHTYLFVSSVLVLSSFGPPNPY